MLIGSWTITVAYLKSLSCLRTQFRQSTNDAAQIMTASTLAKSWSGFSKQRVRMESSVKMSSAPGSLCIHKITAFKAQKTKSPPTVSSEDERRQDQSCHDALLLHRHLLTKLYLYILSLYTVLNQSWPHYRKLKPPDLGAQMLKQH